MPPKKGIIPPAETIKTITKLKELLESVFPQLFVRINGLSLIVIKEKIYTITYNNHCCKWSIEIQNKSDRSSIFDFAETADEIIKRISDEK